MWCARECPLFYFSRLLGSSYGAFAPHYERSAGCYERVARYEASVSHHERSQTLYPVCPIKQLPNCATSHEPSSSYCGKIAEKEMNLRMQHTPFRDRLFVLRKTVARRCFMHCSLLMLVLFALFLTMGSRAPQQRRAWLPRLIWPQSTIVCYAFGSTAAPYSDRLPLLVRAAGRHRATPVSDWPWQRRPIFQRRGYGTLFNRAPQSGPLRGSDLAFAFRHC